VKTLQAEEGLVSLIDVLGTKGIWTRSNPSEVIHNFSFLINKINLIKSKMEDQLYGPFPNIKMNLASYFFSDTIILLLTSDDLESSIKPFGDLLSLTTATGFLNGIYMRGSVSLGKFYRDQESKNSIIIGPAIDEAADWYNMPELIGVHCSPSLKFCIDKIHSEDPDSDLGIFYKYNIPIKNDKVYQSYLVNWFRGLVTVSNHEGDTNLLPELSCEDLDGCKRQILQKFSANPAGPIEYLKLKNTIEFCEFIQKNTSN
jgi:hypothetical protein